MDATVIRSDPDSEFYTPERCHILELSNSPADDALSIAQARVEPGVTTAFHRIKGTAERYVVLNGQGRVELGENFSETVRSGDVVLIPSDVEQRITNTGDDDLVFLALCTPRFRPENYEDSDATNSRGG
jgi:mannose-6-phosphate isomerase-like protein (cupin superfamily)